MNSMDCLSLKNISFNCRPTMFNFSSHNEELKKFSYDFMPVNLCCCKQVVSHST